MDTPLVTEKCYLNQRLVLQRISIKWPRIYGRDMTMRQRLCEATENQCSIFDKNRRKKKDFFKKNTQIGTAINQKIHIFITLRNTLTY